MEKSTCPRCGGEMTCEEPRLSLGGDGWSAITAAMSKTFEVELWLCPQCGKVELFRAEPDILERLEREQVTCPECGTRHSAAIACPECLKKAARRWGI